MTAAQLRSQPSASATYTRYSSGVNELHHQVSHQVSELVWTPLSGSSVDEFHFFCIFHYYLFHTYFFYFHFSARTRPRVYSAGVHSGLQRSLAILVVEEFHNHVKR